MREISQLFEGVEDPRRSNATRHDLCEMLMIGLLCVMCGGEGCVDMARFGRSKLEFLLKFMKLEHGIPSHDAFSDLFNALDPGGLHDALLKLASGWGELLKDDVIAVDGKALRRSFKDAASRSPLHLVHAFAAQSRLVVGQVRVDAKSNEITAMPKLLELLDVKGRIITADAMHTQRSTAEEVTRRRGDYVLALKGNQEKLHDEVRFHFADPDNAEKMLFCKDLDKDHGRIELREATVCHDVQALQDLHHWPGLEAVGKVEATREIKGKRETETRFFLLSSKMTPERFLGAVRAHWAVENSLHWVLDVTMNEDAQRNRTGSGPENLALMRRLALNIARAHPGKDSMRGKLKKAAWRNEYLLELIRSAVKVKEAKKS